MKLLDTLETDFEYEGEMGPDVALNHEMQAKYYPFSRLTGPANILVMPGLQSANISSKLIKALGGEVALGPYLMGMALPVQIAPMTRDSIGTGHAWPCWQAAASTRSARRLLERRSADGYGGVMSSPEVGE